MALKNVRYLDHIVGHGQAFYAATCKHQAEGIVSKRLLTNDLLPMRCFFD